MNQTITNGSVRYYKILAETEQAANTTRSVAAVARRFLRRFLAGLRVTRRRQAALIIAQYRHLVADAETAPPPETKTKSRR